MTQLVQNGLKWDRNSPSGPNWTEWNELDKSRPNWIELNQNRPN